MKLSVRKQTVDFTAQVFIKNATDDPVTGLVYNSAGLVCYYARPLATPVAVPLITQTVTGAHADGGFVEISASNVPGLYRLDLPDAIFAVGVSHASAMLHGASGMKPKKFEFSLVDRLVKEVYDKLAGPGSTAHTITVKTTSNVIIPGAEVWVTTDIAGTNIIAGTRITDDFGQVTFMLDAGTYYLWRDHDDYEFTNPQEFTV